MNFLWSPFPGQQIVVQKILEHFGENPEENSGENPGRKFEKFGEL